MLRALILKINFLLLTCYYSFKMGLGFIFLYSIGTASFSFFLLVSWNIWIKARSKKNSLSCRLCPWIKIERPVLRYFLFNHRPKGKRKRCVFARRANLFSPQERNLLKMLRKKYFVGGVLINFKGWLYFED